MQTAERLSACRARSLSGAASVFCYECYGHPDGCRNLKTICTVILSTAYLGNVQYYTKLLSGRAQIDLHEHYQKQSCRNRCDILSTGGPTTLVVPV